MNEEKADNLVPILRRFSVAVPALLTAGFAAAHFWAYMDLASGTTAFLWAWGWLMAGPVLVSTEAPIWTSGVWPTLTMTCAMAILAHPIKPNWVTGVVTTLGTTAWVSLGLFVGLVDAFYKT